MFGCGSWLVEWQKSMGWEVGGNVTRASFGTQSRKIVAHPPRDFLLGASHFFFCSFNVAAEFYTG